MTTVQASAPGKLYIAGEYAVVDGAAAIAVAVNRYVTITIEDENLQLTTTPRKNYYGIITSKNEKYKPLLWTRSLTQAIAILDDEHDASTYSGALTDATPGTQAERSAKYYAYVLAAMRVVDAYARECNAPNMERRLYNLHVDSELDDAKSGRKYGLGSSAAVTVATVRALCEWYGLSVSTPTIAKLALIVSSKVAKSGSGGDVAASAYGGWIMYRAYNREWLGAELTLVESGESSFSKLLRKKWPRLEVRRLNVSPSLKLLVGWTGSPASSAELVSSVESSVESGAGSGAGSNAGSNVGSNAGYGAAETQPSVQTQPSRQTLPFTYEDFCACSEACVQRLIIALESYDLLGIARGFACNRQLLNDLGALTGTTIETPQLTELIESATNVGLPAKTSGAGGGDCGIAVVSVDDTDRADFVKSRWKEKKIQPLNLKIAKITGTGKSSENIVLKCACDFGVDNRLRMKKLKARTKDVWRNQADFTPGLKADFTPGLNFDDIRLPKAGDSITAAAFATSATSATSVASATSATSVASAKFATSVTSGETPKVERSVGEASLITQRRKNEHIALATEQYQAQADAGFDAVRLMPNALPQIALEEVDASVRVLNVGGNSVGGNSAGENNAKWRSPLYINAMTGGSAAAQEINAQLARVAAKTGVAMASGSLSAALRDATLRDTFSVIRSENPHGFVMANVSAGTSSDDALRAVSMLQANALQVHLNAAQELVMPEGDRDFRDWLHNIERIVRACEAERVPVIVKETGCGMTARDVLRLRDVGVRTVDVSGRGGTNFVAIENARRARGANVLGARGANMLGNYDYLANWGLTTVESLRDIRNCEALKSDPVEIFASGGVRTPLDVVRALALGASAVGVAGEFLHTLVHEGEDALAQQITEWQEQIRVIMALLGCTTVADLQTNVNIQLS